MIAVPRHSATVCVLRRRGPHIEVLMAQRGVSARFMGGAWVFPGGVVDEVDRSDDVAEWFPGVPPEHRPWVSAAARELAEEAGIWLSDPPELVAADRRPRGRELFDRTRPALELARGMRLFSNWITPTVAPVRFDTRFYVVEVPSDTDAVVDGVELDAVQWISPPEAVARAEADEMLIPFPTVRTLKHLAALGGLDAVLRYAESNGESVAPIQPRIRVTDDGEVEALLPGDPGYDETPDASPDEGFLDRAATVRAATGERIPELERRRS